MNPKYFGINQVIDKLTGLFVSHFKHFLPSIAISIKDKLIEIDEDLDSLGSSYTIDQSGLVLVNSYIAKLSDTVTNLLGAKMKTAEENRVSFELRTLYNSVFEDFQEKRKPSVAITDEKLMEILVRTEGHDLSGFPAAEVIRIFMDQESGDIVGEVDSFFDSVYQIVQNILRSEVEAVCVRFPDLSDKLEELVFDFMNTVKP